MHKNSNLLIALLTGLSAGTALGLLVKFNRRPKLLRSPSNKRFESSDKLLQNRFRSENDEDFEDHVEHI